MNLRSRIAAREEVRGVMVKAASPEVVELCGLAGLDFVIIDAEHGPIGPQECTEMVRAAEARRIEALVRLPDHTSVNALRYLETGASGVHVPSVGSATMLGEVMESLFHSPRGRRGLAGGRWASWGAAGGLAEATELAQEELTVVIHIEDPAGFASLDELIGEARVDVYYLGPVDLSNALGFPGQVDRPDIQQMCSDAVGRILDANRIAGMVVRNIDEIVHWRNIGVTYFVGSAESLMLRTFKSFATDSR